MGPLAFDEFLTATTLALFTVLWAIADHAPSAQILQVPKDLLVRRLRPTPKGTISARGHHLCHLLCVLRV